MKKLLFLLLFVPLVAKADDIPFNISDLSNGEVNMFDPMLIPDNSVYEARNVLFDDVSMIKKRHGMAKLNTSAVGNSGPIYNQFQFKKSDGTNYHIIVASNTLYYKASGATFTAFLASVSTATSITNFEVFMDTLQFCNGTANLQYWDTSKVATTTTAYQPKYLLAWQNRLWIAGDTDEPSSLRSSKYLDPFTWTIPASNAVATDPVLFDINSQDGQKIIGIKKSPNGYLLILKEMSCWEVGGVDRDDFSLRLVSPDLGCVNQGSFAYKEGKATWLSKNGFVEYDGNVVKLISKPIQTTVDAIQQLSVSGGSFVKTDPSQWALFSSTSFVDMSSSPGSVKNQFETISTHSLPANDYGNIVKTGNNYVVVRALNGYGVKSEVYTDGAYIGLFTINSNTSCIGYSNNFGSWNTSVVDSTGKIHLAYLGTYSGSYQIRYSSSTDGVTWTDSLIGTCSGGNYVSIALDSNNNPNIIVQDDSSGWWDVRFFYLNGTVWVNGGIIGDTGFDHRYNTLSIDSNNHLNISYMHRVGGVYTAYVLNASSGASSAWSETSTGYAFGSSDITDFSAGINSTNKTYMTVGKYIVTNSTGGWAKTLIDSTADLTRVKIASDNVPRIIYRIPAGWKYTEYIPASASYSTILPISDKAVGAAVNVYVGNDGLPAMMFQDAVSSAHGSILTSTATYVSEIWDTGYPSGITYDMFATQETDNDYNVNHYLRSNASSGTITSAVWTQITKNAVPAGSSSRYIQYKLEISTDVLTSNLPTIDSINLSYHSTTGSTRLSSMYYKQRVYNAVSISSGSVLDRMIVYDQNDRWTEHTSGINCMSLLNLDGVPYYGADNGFVYQMDVGDSDDGAAINAYVLTKDYPFNPIYMKNLNKLFILAGNSGNYNLNLYYYLDRNATANESFAVDLDQTPGMINYKVPLNKNTPFNTIQFKIFNGVASQPFDVYGMYGFYTLQPLR